MSLTERQKELLNRLMEEKRSQEVSLGQIVGLVRLVDMIITEGEPDQNHKEIIKDLISSSWPSAHDTEREELMQIANS